MLAVQWFPSAALYTFSFMIPITLTVMMRWGWPAVFYAMGSGVVYCLLNLSSATGINFACYIIGNAFIALMLLPTYLIGKDRIRSRWWASALYALGGWVCVYLGRSLVWVVGYAISPVAGAQIWSGFAAFALGDFLSAIMAVLVICILRRLDGMFEDQISYLKRVEKQRKDKIRIDQFGENLGEIDEETFDILNKDSDLF